jgi:hypothetical protein
MIHVLPIIWIVVMLLFVPKQILAPHVLLHNAPLEHIVQVRVVWHVLWEHIQFLVL